MDWIRHFQLFLFDFDGLLVDTEPLHFESYRELCRRHGCELPWSFPEFCKEAHGKAMGIFDAFARQFPSMFAAGMTKEVLYNEKKAIYVEMLKNTRLELMEGATDLLRALSQAKSKRAVVTNSPREHIEIIKGAIPILQSIPLWVTREDYSQPKPSPEGYLAAISKLMAAPADRIIGFEDTLKGLKALLAAEVESILVCPVDSAHVKESISLGAKHFGSLAAIKMT
jgi:HAD superfamily hydrolase (TIGR01509 family)